jgi:hypothetical protein
MHNGSPDAKRKPLSNEPWCWVEKPKLRMIADIFSQNTVAISINTARSIYLAVTEIASDKESDVFDASHEEIAHRAGVSPSSVKRILPVFRKLGLLKVKRNWINGLETRSTYTIIRGKTLAHHEPALGQPTKGKRATSEELAKRKARNERNNTCGTSLADGPNDIVTDDPDIVIRNGERFNLLTGEYEWGNDE